MKTQQQTEPNNTFIINSNLHLKKKAKKKIFFDSPHK